MDYVKRVYNEIDKDRKKLEEVFNEVFKTKNIFKETIESFEKIKPFSIPEIRLPRREKDCPAAPICEAIGNIRRGCTEGSEAAGGPGLEACIAGFILLYARIAGMWPQEMIEEVETRRKVGFDPCHKQNEPPQP